MRKISILCLTFLLLVTGGQSVLAAARAWELDKAHSNFYFSVAHIFSKVQGHFNEYSGEIHFDPENLADSRLYFAIETDSVEMLQILVNAL